MPNSLQDECLRLSRSIGIELDIAPFVPDWLKSGGFEDIDHAVRVVPVGTWPKDRKLKQIGYYMMAQIIETALDSFTIALFTRHGGWNEEQTRLLLNRVIEETKSNKQHIYTK
jgi:hypothetical protein